MFKGFQNTSNNPRVTQNTSNLFAGIPSITSTSSVPYSVINDGSIIAWWNGSYGVTTTTASTVSSWVDVIGGYTFSQSTASLQPTFIASDPLFNGYPSINFGTTSTLSAGNVLNIGTLAGMTMIIVGRTNNVTSAGLAFLSKDSGSNPANNGEYQIHVYPGTNLANSYYDSGGLRFPTQTVIPLSCNIISSNVIDRTAGLLSAYNYVPYQFIGNTTYNINGAVSSASTAIVTGTTNYTPTAPLNINKSNTGLTLLEIIYYNRALSYTEASQTILALKNKYKFS